MRFNLRRALTAPRRLMRRRGFGVHSPFAFDFIRHVIAQPCRYYCYPELTAAAKAAGMSPKQLKLLFRIALFLQPKSYIVQGQYEKICTKAIKLGAPQARCRIDYSYEMDSFVDLYVMTPGRPPERSETDDVLHKYYSDPEVPDFWRKVIVCFHDKPKDMDLSTVLWETRKKGMLFKSSTSSIFIGRDDLPHQRFDLWF